LLALESHWRKRALSGSRSGTVNQCTDRRNLMRLKMSRIQNTGLLLILNQRTGITFYPAAGARTKSSWNRPILHKLLYTYNFLETVPLTPRTTGRLSRNCPFNTQDYRTRRPCCRRLWFCPSSCPTSSRGYGGPGRGYSWSDLQVRLTSLADFR
jgi:hypothetical protein